MLPSRSRLPVLHETMLEYLRIRNLALLDDVEIGVAADEAGFDAFWG